jgi:PAN domain
MVTGRELVVVPDVVIRNTTEKNCLQSCLAKRNPPCLSVSFDAPTNDCALRSVNRFTNPQDFKETDRKLRYFDNNCQDELPRQSHSSLFHFGSLPSPGFFLLFSGNATYEIVVKNLATHFSDTDYVDIPLSQCADLCRSNPDYPCRAFFFGNTVLGRFCGLMHLTAAAVAKIPGGNFPVDGVNVYQPIKNAAPKGQTFVPNLT